MKIIILEWIPTSGKSIILEKLKKKIIDNNKIVSIWDDHDVVWLLDSRKDITNKEPVLDSQTFLINLLQEKIKNKPDYIIFHNFHLFYIVLNFFRWLEEDIAFEYKRMEDELLKYKTLIVFLRIDTQNLADHFLKTIKKREEYKPWTNTGYFWESKWINDEERVNFYENKQKMYDYFLKQSIIPYMEFKTKNDFDLYENIANEILNYFYPVQKED